MASARQGLEVVATHGLCQPFLFNLSVGIRATIKSDVQLNEGINSKLKRDHERSRNMQLPLVDARVRLASHVQGYHGTWAERVDRAARTTRTCVAHADGGLAIQAVVQLHVRTTDNFLGFCDAP